MAHSDKTLREENDYYYSPIPWRYSGLRAKAFGIDPLVLLLIPTFFWGLRQEWPFIAFVLLVGVFVLFILIAFWGYPSLLFWMRAMNTRYIQGAEWKTR